MACCWCLLTYSIIILWPPSLHIDLKLRAACSVVVLADSHIHTVPLDRRQQFFWQLKQLTSCLQASLSTSPGLLELWFSVGKHISTVSYHITPSEATRLDSHKAIWNSNLSSLDPWKPTQDCLPFQIWSLLWRSGSGFTRSCSLARLSSMRIAT